MADTTKIVAALIIGVVIGAGGMYAVQLLQQPTPPTEIEFWTPFLGQSASEDFYEWFADMVSERYPNLTLSVTHWDGSEWNTKLTTAFAAGEPPDLFIRNPGHELKSLVDAGHVYNLDTVLGEPWAVAQIPQSARTIFTYNGSIWGMPWELSVGGIIANPKLFAEAGVTLPNASLGEAWNWTEFFDVCNTLNASGIVPLAMPGGSGRHSSVVFDFIMERVAGQTAFLDALTRTSGAFNDTDFVAAYTLWQEIADNASIWLQPGWETDGYGDCVGAFESNTTAMWILYQWPVASIIADTGIEPVYVRVPEFPGGYGNSDPAAYINSVCIANATDNLESAKKVLRLHAEAESIRKYAEISQGPTAHDVALPPGVFVGWLETALEVYSTATEPVIRKSPFAPVIDWATAYEESVLGVLHGLKTPQEAADDLEQATADLHAAGEL